MWAELYKAQGKYAEATPLYRRSLTILEKALGPEHPNVATSLNGLAALYKAQGNYAEAAPLFQRSLAIREKTLGPEHPDVAASLHNLAGLHHDQGNYAEAAPLYRRSLAISEKALGPEHPSLAPTLIHADALKRPSWVMNRPSAPSKIPSVFRPKRDIRRRVSAIHS